ncbi:unnamed protein product [Calypogeia fissa]
MLKDCINEPHFKRDSFSRVNPQRTSDDSPIDLSQPVVPPVEVLQPVSLTRPSTANPAAADPLVRISVAANLGTDLPSFERVTVPDPNSTGVKSVSADTYPVILDDQVLLVDTSLGPAPQAITSPSLPAHLRIRTVLQPEAQSIIPEPFHTTNLLELPTQLPTTSFLPEPSHPVHSPVHSTGQSPLNQGNSSGSKRWADYSSDCDTEPPLPSHSPGGSRLVLSPHQLTTDARQRDHSLSPYRRESECIKLKSAARQARRSGNLGNRRGRK